MKIVAPLTILFMLTACATVKKPFYYEARRDGETIYLLGTVHHGVGFGELPSYVRDDFAASPTFACEITDELTDGLLHPDRDCADCEIVKDNIRKNIRLSNRLTITQWNKFTGTLPEALTSYKVDFLPPRLAFLLFQQTSQSHLMVTRAMANRAEAAMDKDAYEQAVEDKKKIVRLDTTDVLTGTCYFSLLQKSLDEFDPTDASRGNKAMEELNQVVVAYREGDEAAMTAHFDADALTQCLLVDRNKRWTDTLAGQALRGYAKPPFFVAVGAAHLLGKNSLLDMLKERGFEVKRVAR